MQVPKPHDQCGQAALLQRSKALCFGGWICDGAEDVTLYPDVVQHTDGSNGAAVATRRHVSYLKRTCVRASELISKL